MRSIRPAEATAANTVPRRGEPGSEREAGECGQRSLEPVDARAGSRCSRMPNEIREAASQSVHALDVRERDGGGGSSRSRSCGGARCPSDCSARRDRPGGQADLNLLCRDRAERRESGGAPTCARPSRDAQVDQGAPAARCGRAPSSTVTTAPPRMAHGLEHALGRREARRRWGPRAAARRRSPVRADRPEAAHSATTCRWTRGRRCARTVGCGDGPAAPWLRPTEDASTADRGLPPGAAAPGFTWCGWRVASASRRRPRARPRRRRGRVRVRGGAAAGAGAGPAGGAGRARPRRCGREQARAAQLAAADLTRR